MAPIAELNAEIKKAGEVLGGEVNKNYLHEGILDLHKPYVDEVVLVSKSGKPMKRIPDLVDVWFDSGAMPMRNGISLLENKEVFAQNYPAGFIAEGVDQTRGWFYTLHALGSLLKESVQEEPKKAGFAVSDEQYLGLAYKTCGFKRLSTGQERNK